MIIAPERAAGKRVSAASLQATRGWNFLTAPMPNTTKIANTMI
jgi:hypothetical protein